MSTLYSQTLPILNKTVLGVRSRYPITPYQYLGNQCSGLVSIHSIENLILIKAVGFRCHRLLCVYVCLFMRAPACACIHSESFFSDLSFKLCSYCLLQCWGSPWGLAHARKHAATDSAPAFRCCFLALILFVCECFARMYVRVPCLCRVRGVHMETLDTMKLDFQTLVSFHVSAEN